MQRICTAQRWALSTRDDASYDRFEYAIDNPLPKDQTWRKKLESLVRSTPTEHDCIIWVYLFERVNYRFMLFLIVAYVVLSTAGGVAYAIFMEDVSSGLTISTYVSGWPRRCGARASISASSGRIRTRTASTISTVRMRFVR